MASSLLGGVIAPPQTNGYRLSLTTAVAVTTADVVGGTSIFCTPYTGDTLALYDGTATWQLFNPGEFSLALGTLADGTKPYDVFCFNSAGAPTLEFLVWTSTSARATALVRQNGVWCKTGALTRRYMGTFMPTATTTTEDSALRRYLFNSTNRVRRHLVVTDTTASWTYSLAAYRQANGSTTNIVQMVVGLSEDSVDARTHVLHTNDTGQVNALPGIGIDSNTVNSAQIYGATEPTSAQYNVAYAMYKGFPGIGQHDLRWLESTSATGITTWYGGRGAAGLLADVMN